MILLNFYL